MSEEKKYHDFLDGKVSREELDPEIAAFLDNTSQLKVPKGSKSNLEIWDTIASEVDKTEEKETKTIGLKGWQVMAIAAVITLLIVALPQILQNSDPEIFEARTTIAQTQSVDLPDGSQVTLNAASEINYEGADERVVRLKGEAFFEVEKGVPFKVITGNGIVEVLGTSFNVKSRGDVFEVSCKTGKVAVSIESTDQAKKLLPGEGIVKDLDTVRFTTLNEEIIGKWSSGEFYFEAKPLEEVLAEIQRQFNVEVTSDTLEQRLFTGYFNNESLDLALTIVCEPLGLQYKITDNEKVIITEGPQ